MHGSVEGSRSRHDPREHGWGHYRVDKERRDDVHQDCRGQRKVEESSEIIKVPQRPRGFGGDQKLASHAATRRSLI